MIMKKFKTGLIKTSLKYYKSLNIWEKILLFIFFVGFIVTTHFIFVGSISHLHSDTASYNILMREQMFSKQLFPSDWIYSQDIQVLTINIPMIFLSLFIKDQFLLKCTAVFLQSIILLVVLIIYGKYIFKNNSLLIYGAILFSVFSASYLENVFSHSGYGYIIIITLLVFLFSAFSVNDEFKINKKYIILSYISIFIASIGGMRYYGTIMIPILGSFILVYIIDNNQKELKKIIIDLKRIAIWIIIIFASILAGYLVYRWITTTRSFVKGHSDLILRSWTEIDKILESFKNTIAWLWALFGVGFNENLFSFNGISNLFKMFTTFAIMIVFPVLLTKKYHVESLNIKRLIIFSWLSFIITSIVFIFCEDVALKYTSSRYFIVALVFQIMLSSYYVYKYLLKENIIICFVSFVFLVFLLISNIYAGVTISISNNAKNNKEKQKEFKTFFKEKELKLGYATYWNSYTNSILFNYKPEIIPLDYSIDQDMSTFSPCFFLTSKRFYRQEYYSGKTFLLLTPHEFNIFKSNVRLQKLYGTPEETCEKNGFFIVIYNYNISSEFRGSKFMFGKRKDVLFESKYNEFVEYKKNIITLKRNGILFGPYWTLDKGKYQIIVDCEYPSNEAVLPINIHTDFGHTIIPASKNILESGNNVIEFILHETVDLVEIVVVNSQFDEVKIKEMSTTMLE